jgi:hypothetical protein
MTEMIKQVARALDKCGQERGCRIPAVMVQHLAAAAIEAMHAPTIEMACAAAGESEGRLSTQDAIYIWQDMIDAALSPAERGTDA